MTGWRKWLHMREHMGVRQPPVCWASSGVCPGPVTCRGVCRHDGVVMELLSSRSGVSLGLAEVVRSTRRWSAIQSERADPTKTNQAMVVRVRHTALRRLDGSGLRRRRVLRLLVHLQGWPGHASKRDVSLCDERSRGALGSARGAVACRSLTVYFWLRVLMAGATEGRCWHAPTCTTPLSRSTRQVW